MEQFRELASIQRRAAWSLVTLAAVDSNQIKIVEEGGVRALVNALRDHPQDVNVQYEVLMGLVNVSVNDANRAYVVKEEAHTEVVASMARHTDSWMVQAAGCWVIGNLADNRLPVNQLELGLKGAH